jgi:hypothetical protein
MKAANGSCFQIILQPTVETIRALIQWWKQNESSIHDGSLEVVERLLARYESDRHVFSGVFDPSVSHDSDGWHFFRFSYAFPWFHLDMNAIVDFIVSLWEPLGEDLCYLFKDLLRYASKPCVDQLLVGLSDEGDGKWRAKLYYQFTKNAGGTAWDLAVAISGNQYAREIDPMDGLHCLGLDLGRGGIRTSKWYIRRNAAALARLDSDYGSNTGIAELSQRARITHLDHLIIYKESSQHDHNIVQKRRIDFNILENNFTFDDLLHLKPMAPFREPQGRFRDMLDPFSIVPRIVSISLDDNNDINLYYSIL